MSKIIIIFVPEIATMNVLKENITAIRPKDAREPQVVAISACAFLILYPRTI